MEGSAREQILDEAGPAALEPSLVDPHQPRVAQRRQELSLASEALQLRPLEGLAQELLERVALTGGLVTDLEHRPHAASAQLAPQHVARQGAGRRRRRPGPRPQPSPVSLGDLGRDQPPFDEANRERDLS